MSEAAILALIPFLRGYGFVFAPVITADMANYNLKAQAIAAGWDQVVPLIAEVTVKPGIVLSANATNQYGFDTGVGFPAGTSLKLVLRGYVCGMGGFSSSGVGAPGGPALRAQHPLTVDAAGGTIAGGGGQGGRGNPPDGSIYPGNSGGGGRSGRVATEGASPYAGTFAAPGIGVSDYSMGSRGGSGGDWGAAGTFVSAGAGGAAVVGNAHITWINTGTRYGAVT